MKTANLKIRGAFKMYYAKLRQPAVKEGLKSWFINLLLVGACVWTFLLLGGCKTPESKSQHTVVNQSVSKEDINNYLNDSVNEITPPEIMDHKMGELPDELKDTPPVNPQVDASF